MKRRIFLAALAAVLVLLTLHPAGAAGGAKGVSSPGATDLSKYLHDAVSRGDIPGVVALVVTRDRVVYVDAFGSLSDAKKAAMPRNAIFNIASMTKPITSVAIMQLVEQGKLRLDDNAATYLPQLAKLPVLSKADLKAGTWQTRPAHGPITIKELLTHTSGVGYSFDNPALSLVSAKTKAADGDLPLVGDPGQQWWYGASTKLLGDVIAKVTGQPLDRYIESRILQPLGMRDTSYAVAPANRSRVVSIHRRDDRGRWVEQPAPDVPPVTVRGDGGLYSTAGDYAQFIRMMLNGGSLNGTTIVSPQTVRQMTSNQIGSLVVPLMPTANPAISKPFPLGAGKAKWGLGFLLAPDAGPDAPSAGSYSWAGIYNTEFWIDPQKQMGAVLLMQTLPFYDDKAIEVLRGFEARVYRSLE